MLISSGTPTKIARKKKPMPTSCFTENPIISSTPRLAHQALRPDGEEDHKRDEVFSFPGTVSYLVWLRRPAVVRKEEIETIQKWLGQYNHSDIDISDILPGDYVRITSGPFSGQQAILLDKTNKKAVVQLKELGLQLSLSLSNSDLTVI